MRKNMRELRMENVWAENDQKESPLTGFYEIPYRKAYLDLEAAGVMVIHIKDCARWKEGNANLSLRGQDYADLCETYAEVDASGTGINIYIPREAENMMTPKAGDIHSKGRILLTNRKINKEENIYESDNLRYFISQEQMNECETTYRDPEEDRVLDINNPVDQLKLMFAVYDTVKELEAAQA